MVGTGLGEVTAWQDCDEAQPKVGQASDQANDGGPGRCRRPRRQIHSQDIASESVGCFGSVAVTSTDTDTPAPLRGEMHPTGSLTVGLAGAGVPDQAKGFAAADPLSGGEGVDGGGVDVRVGVVVEVLEVFLPGESGGFDPSEGGAAVAVVDLGQEEFGE